MASKEHTIGHVCPQCINAVFWAHRKALDKILDIANTSECESVKYKGMVDVAFDCLSFFDLYYDSCLTHKTGTLKENEVWVSDPEKK